MDGQNEIVWKVIPQTCGLYEVSNFGDVREAGVGNVLTVSVNSKGYAIVSLPKIKKMLTVHRVVAEMFVPKPTGNGNRLDSLQVDHIDGARLNNDARNLRWVTASENRKNAHRRGKYHMHTGKAIKRICIKTGEVQVFDTLIEAAASVGMGWSSVSERLQTGRPTKSGYLFKYTKKKTKVEKQDGQD